MIVCELHGQCTAGGDSEQDAGVATQRIEHRTQVCGTLVKR